MEKVLFKADVTKADRTVKVLAKDWRYQAAQIQDEWCISQVGTCGMASAQLYWGRLAALILRFIYRLVLAVDWRFVFGDDFCWILRQKHAHRHTALFLALLFAMIPPELEENQTCPGHGWVFLLAPKGFWFQSNQANMKSSCYSFKGLRG